MPIRTCVGCRQRFEQDELIRIRATDDGLAVGAGPGRGAWVGPSPQCLAQAIKRRALNRALQTAPDADQVASITDSWSSGPAACEHSRT